MASRSAVLKVDIVSAYNGKGFNTAASGMDKMLASANKAAKVIGATGRTQPQPDADGLEQTGEVQVVRGVERLFEERA